MRRGAGLVVLAVFGLAGGIDAQRIEITPYVGVYRPLVDQGPGLAGDVDCPPDDLKWCMGNRVVLGLDASTSMGVRVSVRGGGLLGLEATMVTATPARRREYWCDCGPNLEQAMAGVERSVSRITTVAARIVLAPRLTDRVRVALGAGLSSTTLSGEAYYDIEGPEHRSIVGPTVGLSLGANVTPIVHLDVGMDYRVYSLRFERWGTTSTIVQHDLTLWSGVGVALVR